MIKNRWIAYFHGPFSHSFDIAAYPSLYEAGQGMKEYGRNTGFHEEATAALYPYSEEDWAEAQEYAEIGCPFDYPSKLMQFGPRGGIKVENA